MIDLNTAVGNRWVDASRTQTERLLGLNVVFTNSTSKAMPCSISSHLPCTDPTAVPLLPLRAFVSPFPTLCSTGNEKARDPLEGLSLAAGLERHAEWIKRKQLVSYR